MKMIFLWATCLVVITGCNAPQENHDQIENGGTKIENKSENSNFYGTYAVSYTHLTLPTT